MTRTLMAFALTLFAAIALAKEIASPAPDGASEPFLAAAADGALLMSWLEPVDGGAALRFATFRDGRWSAARTIVQGDQLMVNWANAPAIVAAPNRWFALWLQKHGTGHDADVYVASSTDGGATWSAPRILHHDGKATEHGFASLVALGADAAAVWLDGRNTQGEGHGDMQLRYARVSSKGTLSAEAVLDSRVCECCGTGMTMTASGPLVAYRDRSGEEIRDISVVRWKGGRWSEPVVVHRDGWLLKGCPVNGPQIEARGRQVAVAWFTAANDKPHVSLAFSRDGGASFSKPVPIDAGAPAGRVEVVLLPDGDALAIWVDGLGGDPYIAARRVSPSGRLGEIVKLGPSSASRAAGFPRAAMAGDRVYAAWTDPAAKRIRVAALAAR